MSNTSIGSGNANDLNENPAPDSRPSKTLGAESGPDEHAPGGQPRERAATEADVLGGLLRDMPAGQVADYPDGPNVAPSPSELDAARGKTTLPDKD